MEKGQGDNSAGSAEGKTLIIALTTIVKEKKMKGLEAISERRQKKRESGKDVASTSEKLGSLRKKGGNVHSREKKKEHRHRGGGKQKRRGNSKGEDGVKRELGNDSVREAMDASGLGEWKRKKPG